ncbi:MAG: type II toxin-antitoxin system VapC family toxin, partial [Chloroflexota bacterium]
MKYLDASDWCIDFFKGIPQARSALDALSHEGLAISTVSLMELLEGAFNSRHPQQAEAGLTAFLQDVT